MKDMGAYEFAIERGQTKIAEYLKQKLDEKEQKSKRIFQLIVLAMGQYTKMVTMIYKLFYQEPDESTWLPFRKQVLFRILI